MYSDFKLSKRVLDLIVCIGLIPFALPVCLVAMAIIRLDSRGSPLFVQRRVGRHHVQFQLFKLRTMARQSVDVPSHEINPRQITKVGAFLRRTKIDELPQLLNVLNGSMSLVGPRPCLPSQHLLIAERERHGLSGLLPGVTGPGQLTGLDMSQPALLAQTEAGYFRNATPMKDMMLIIRTIAGGGRGDAVTKLR